MNSPSVASVAGIALTTARVSAKTNWLFVEVADSEGRTGHGEATLQRREREVSAVFEALAPAHLQRRADPALRWAWSQVERTLPGGAAASAIDHALWDLAGQRAGQPLARSLGAETFDVSLYANVNRGLRSRTPEAFAAGARAAVDAGFRAVKIAPFDEIDVHGRWGEPKPATAAALASGIARIEATRASIGPQVELMVDCHWRFDETWAERAIDAVAASTLHWFECPVPEDTGWLPALRRLRSRANRHGMRLAGGEDGVGREAFAPWLAAEAYDVLMPDIKYIGGVAEMFAVAEQAARRGVVIAPHNPSGPIAHLASAHVCTALPAFDRLELQFNESPLFDTLVTPSPPPPQEGRMNLPMAPGLGVCLAPSAPDRPDVQRRVWGRFPESA